VNIAGMILLTRAIDIRKTHTNDELLSALVSDSINGMPRYVSVSHKRCFACEARGF
jgi:hypothetical protein